jgi:hypothetical protein
MRTSHSPKKKTARFIFFDGIFEEILMAGAQA